MTSPSFPVSLDALANPGSTTETDDTGFELDIVVSRLQNIAMALEQKLGIGASAPGAAAAVLRRTAAGASAWGQVVDADVAAAAAINYSKLNLGGFIVNADVAAGAAIATSKLSAGGTANRVIATADGANAAMQQVTQAMLAPNAVSQVLAVTVPSQSTTQVVQVAMTGATLPTFTATGAPVLFAVTLLGVAGPGLVQVQVYEGATVRAAMVYASPPAGLNATFAAVRDFTPAPGSHSYLLTWSTASGTVSVVAGTFAMIELSR